MPSPTIELVAHPRHHLLPLPLSPTIVATMAGAPLPRPSLDTAAAASSPKPPTGHSHHLVAVPPSVGPFYTHRSWKR
jgi:hypothetical protein